MRRRLERQRHDAASAERAARAERGAETERRERQAQLLLRPVRAQQQLWPHPWRPLQLAMHADALRYKQGKKEIAIPLRHVTHVNVVDNDRYLPHPLPPPHYSLLAILTAHYSLLIMAGASLPSSRKAGRLRSVRRTPLRWPRGCRCCGARRGLRAPVPVAPQVVILVARRGAALRDARLRLRACAGFRECCWYRRWRATSGV